MDLTVDEFQSHIQNTYVKPSYERDVKDFNESRYNDRKSGYTFEKYGKYLASLSVLLNFVFTGMPEFKYGGLIAGGIGLLGITYQGIGSWYVTKSSEATESLNKTYKGIGLSIIMPDVSPKKDDDKIHETIPDTTHPPDNTSETKEMDFKNIHIDNLNVNRLNIDKPITNLNPEKKEL